MKKILAVLLAVSMIASMASISFAAKTGGNDGVAAIDSHYSYYDADADLLAPFQWYGRPINYGDAALYLLHLSDGESYVTDSEMVRGLNIDMEYEQGEDLVESVKLVKKNIGQGEGPFFVYMIEIKTKNKVTTADADIIGTITLNKRDKGDDKGKNYKIKDLEQDFAVNVGYNYGYLEHYPETISSDSAAFSLWPNELFLLKFDYDDLVGLEFGLEPNEGTFTVDVSGQGKLPVYYDTELDESITAANPDADIIALNFNNIKFNRTGEFVYEADGMNYAYEIIGGKIVSIGKFVNGEITFDTRVLGRYLFSDIELVSPAEPIPDMFFSTALYSMPAFRG